MDKAEILKRISETEHFLEFSNESLMETLRAIKDDSRIILLAYCLHMAHVNGYKAACQNMMTKAQKGIEWSEALQALGIDLNK
jgi:hypothetical protein